MEIISKPKTVYSILFQIKIDVTKQKSFSCLVYKTPTLTKLVGHYFK